MRKRGIQISVLLVTLGLLAWAVTIGLQRLAAPPLDVTPPPAPPAQPTAHITATLFYAAADGQQLSPSRQEVALADGVVAQGRQILVAQLAPPPDGQRSVIPAGTQLRAFYVTDRGDAFVDVSREISAAHPGGYAQRTPDRLRDRERSHGKPPRRAARPVTRRREGSGHHRRTRRRAAAAGERRNACP